MDIFDGYRRNQAEKLLAAADVAYFRQLAGAVPPIKRVYILGATGQRSIFF